MVMMRIGWPVGALLASAMVAGLLPSYQVRGERVGERDGFTDDAINIFRVGFGKNWD